MINQIPPMKWDRVSVCEDSTDSVGGDRETKSTDGLDGGQLLQGRKGYRGVPISAGLHGGPDSGPRRESVIPTAASDHRGAVPSRHPRLPAGCRVVQAGTAIGRSRTIPDGEP